MALRVIIHRAAEREMDETLLWLRRRAPVTATRWFNDLKEHVPDLAFTATSCAQARESKRTSRSLRESHFGRRPNVFRVIFYIENDAVRVISVRRAQRRGLTRKQIDRTIEDGPRNGGNKET